MLFGSRPAARKPLSQSTNSNTMVGTPLGRRGKERRESGRGGPITPVNYVALPKEDSISRCS